MAALNQQPRVNRPQPSLPPSCPSLAEDQVRRAGRALADTGKWLALSSESPATAGASLQSAQTWPHPSHRRLPKFFPGKDSPGRCCLGGRAATPSVSGERPGEGLQGAEGRAPPFLLWLRWSLSGGMAARELSRPPVSSAQAQAQPTAARHSPPPRQELGGSEWGARGCRGARPVQNPQPEGQIPTGIPARVSGGPAPLQGTPLKPDTRISRTTRQTHDRKAAGGRQLPVSRQEQQLRKARRRQTPEFPGNWEERGSQDARHHLPLGHGGALEHSLSL